MIWEIINIGIGYAFLQGAVGSYKRVKKLRIFWILLVVCSVLAYIFIFGTILKIILYFLGILNTESGSMIAGFLLLTLGVPYYFWLKKYLKRTSDQNGKDKDNS